MDIQLDKVPTRQAGMRAWEILLSESQERMLVVVKKGREAEVQAIFDKWDLNCVEIGTVTQGGTIRFFQGDECVAEVPAESLVLGGGAPVYVRESKEPTYIKENALFDMANIQEPDDLRRVAYDLLSSPNIASKRWVSEQYDSMVRTNNMSTNAPSDAGLVLIKETGKALAVTVDCNSRYVHADPYKGTMIAVSEAARNIACTGGEPCGVTNCLNFGNPYDPEVYWQFEQAIKGMGDACQAFDTPVTGGNVSFYNHTVTEKRNIPVFPTPTIGMVGIVPDIAKRMSLDFKDKGDLIFLLGNSVEDIACSEYLVRHHGVDRSPAPYFDLEEERRLHTMLLILIRKGLINAAHDISEGGLWATLVEMGLPRGLGFDVITDSEIRPDAFLFGEGQGRAVVAVNEDEEIGFLDLMQASRIPFVLLGHVTKGKLMVDDAPFGSIEDVRKVYEETIPKVMSEQ